MTTGTKPKIKKILYPLPYKVNYNKIKQNTFINYFVKTFKNIIFLLALYFAQGCKSSEPIIDSSQFTTTRTKMDPATTSAINFSRSPGYDRNKDIYDKIGLATGYQYTGINIAKERIAGSGVTIGVVEVLGNGAMPYSNSLTKDSISGTYLYSSSGTINQSTFRTLPTGNITVTPTTIANDSSGDHAVGVISLLTAKRGDQLYGVLTYDESGDSSYVAFDSLDDESGVANQKMNGVAYNSKILFVGGTGSVLGNSGAIPSIVNFMYNKGARVVNMSLGSQDSDPSNSEGAAFASITKNKSLIMVASAGNSAGANPLYPAKDANAANSKTNNLGALLSVVSTDYNTETISSFSNKCGSTIYCLAAPGLLSSSTTSDFAVVASHRYYDTSTGFYYKPISFTDSASKATIYALEGYDGKVYTSDGKVYENQTNAEEKSGGTDSTTYTTVISSSNIKIREVLESAAGTSYSAPIVSGVAANLMAAFPTLSGKTIADMMLKYSKPLGGTGRDQGDWDTNKLSSDTGWGLVDFYSTVKGIDESTLGYNPKNVSSASIAYTALSVSPVIGGSVGAINNALSNAVFTDAFGYSFNQSLNYKTYAQNGYGGYTNGYSGSTSYTMGGMTDFYTNFFLSNSREQNSKSGSMQFASGTSVSFNLSNHYYNQGSLLNINENKLTKGFLSALSPSQNPYSVNNSFALAQNFGKVDFVYAKNTPVSQIQSSVLSLASSNAIGSSYKMGYALTQAKSFSLTYSNFSPFNFGIVKEFANSNFNRKLSEMSFQQTSKNQKSFYNIAIGNMTENGSFLTTLTGGAFFVNGANTSYIDINAKKSLSKNISIDFSTSIGSTRVNTNTYSIFSGFSNLITTSHSLGLEKSNFLFNSSKYSNALRFGLKMPLSVVKGSAVLFDGANYNSVSLAQTARQMDYELSYRVSGNGSINSTGVYFSLIHSQNFVNIKGLTNKYALFTIKKSTI